MDGEPAFDSEPQFEDAPPFSADAGQPSLTTDPTEATQNGILQTAGTETAGPEIINADDFTPLVEEGLKQEPTVRSAANPFEGDLLPTQVISEQEAEQNIDAPLPGRLYVGAGLIEYMRGSRTGNLGRTHGASGRRREDQHGQHWVVRRNRNALLSRRSPTSTKAG